MPQSPESKARTARTGPTGLVQGLERIREALQAKLDQLEAVAREQVAAVSQVDLEQERELEQRIAGIEEAQRRLRSETERWEKERQTALEQLEHDRKLLAESWQRLEREQLENHAPARPAPESDRVQPVVLRTSAIDPNDPVTQAILKQFQTLRRDVRRNASGQRRG
jgi:DNA repair exonuclease SbcCD ATPase subunit